MNVLINQNHDHAFVVLPDGGVLEMANGMEPVYFTPDTIGANSARHIVDVAEKRGGKSTVGRETFTLHRPQGTEEWTTPAETPAKWA